MVQILLLDPDSPLADQRGVDLNFADRSRVAHDIRTSVGELMQHCQEERVQDRVEIRLYANTTPTLIMFAYDETVLFSPYLRKHAMHCHFFELRTTEGGYARELDAFFDDVWTHAKPAEVTIT